MPIILNVQSSQLDEAQRIKHGQIIIFSESAERPKVVAAVKEMSTDSISISELRKPQTYAKTYHSFYNLAIPPITYKEWNARSNAGVALLGAGAILLAVGTTLVIKWEQPGYCNFPGESCNDKRNFYPRINLAGLGAIVAGSSLLAINRRKLNRFRWLDHPVFELENAAPYAP